MGKKCVTQSVPPPDGVASLDTADLMKEAIANHKMLEALIKEMREITQTLILETVPGVPRKKPLSEIQKAR